MNVQQTAITGEIVGKARDRQSIGRGSRVLAQTHLPVVDEWVKTTPDGEKILANSRLSSRE